MSEPVIAKQLWRTTEYNGYLRVLTVQDDRIFVLLFRLPFEDYRHRWLSRAEFGSVVARLVGHFPAARRHDEWLKQAMVDSWSTDGLDWFGKMSASCAGS